MPDDAKATAVVPWGERLLTESVALALVPAVAAATVLLYEWGQCSYFGIPVDLATASVWSAFPAVALTLLLVLLMMLAAVVQPAMLKRLRWPGLVGGVVALAVVYAALLGVLVAPWAIWFALGPLTGLLLLTMAPWTVRGRTVGDHMLVAVERFGRRHAAAIVLAVFVASSGYPVGYRQAERRTDYPLLAVDPTGGPGPLVVLQIYSDNLVAAPLDRAGHSFGRDRVVVNLSAVPALRFTVEPVGPLTPAGDRRATTRPG